MELENKKVKRIRKSPAQFEAAVREVIDKKMSIRSVAKSYNIGKSYLARLVYKTRNLPALDNFKHQPNIGNRQIFSKEEEKSLKEYLKTASKMAYGLTTTQTKQLAFEYASKLSKKLPPSWIEKTEAGREWLRGFMKRNQDLSLRQPELTSLSRATSFNPANVKKFYDNLEVVLKRYAITPDRIYNADETGLLTVTDTPKVISQKGAKQVAQATSAERGQLVTMLAFISASGNTIPPVFVFPRQKFKEIMLQDCPPGSLGLAFKSGWMTGENFILSFDHFIKYTKPSKDTPVLLIVDNHESHINLDIIKRARDNGVVIITFPPHCSHKLQPLDVAVYGPFKTYFKIALNNWMVSNPGKTVTIYHLPKLAKFAFESAFTIKNIRNGFLKTGIYPYNSNNFTADDFLTSYVSDQPVPTSNKENIPAEGDEVNLSEADPIPDLEKNTSSQHIHNMPSTSCAVNITPEFIRPFPKAMSRTQSTRGRKKGRARILTDTPEKDELERQLEEKERKESKKLNQIRKKAVKRRLVDEESSDSETSVTYADSDLDYCEEIEDENCVENEKYNIETYVLVKFVSKKTIKCAIGKIIEILSSDELRVKFLKKKLDSFHFIYPDKDDIADIHVSDIEMMLPKPKLNTKSERVKNVYTFAIDFTGVLFC